MSAIYKGELRMNVVNDPVVTFDIHVIENHATIENMRSSVCQMGCYKVGMTYSSGAKESYIQEVADVS